MPLRIALGGEGFLALIGEGRPNVKAELELRLGLRGLEQPEDSVHIISGAVTASIVLHCSLRVRARRGAARARATVGGKSDLTQFKIDVNE